jgi:hypothetical protein
MVAQQQTNPSMFGRPVWSYVNVIRGPVAGPQPRLAQGTGRTGAHAATGSGAQLPGYVSDNSYQPSPFTYHPTSRENFEQLIARTIATGVNGREIVGTYNPYDIMIGQRFNHQMRRAENWQIMAYPPTYRNTLQWQQVQKYRVNSVTLSARPLAANGYFLGYQVQPEIQGQIGQNTLGYMGSV